MGIKGTQKGRRFIAQFDIFAPVEKKNLCLVFVCLIIGAGSMNGQWSSLGECTLNGSTRTTSRLSLGPGSLPLRYDDASATSSKIGTTSDQIRATFSSNESGWPNTRSVLEQQCQRISPLWIWVSAEETTGGFNHSRHVILPQTKTRNKAFSDVF